MAFDVYVCIYMFCCYTLGFMSLVKYMAYIMSNLKKNVTNKFLHTVTYLLLIRQCNLTSIVQFRLQNQEAEMKQKLSYWDRNV